MDDTETREPPEPARLDAFIRASVAEFASTKPRSVQAAQMREFNMTFGCCVQAARFAEAYLVLCNEGLSLEARVAARACLEHAATVEFAYLRTGGLDLLANSAGYSSWSIQNRMYKWYDNDDVKPGPEPQLGPRLPGLSNKSKTGILDLLDPENRLLAPGYAALSQGVHVTNETVTSFFLMSPDRTQMALNTRREDRLADYTRFLVAQACMLVSWILARTCGDQARLEQLEEQSLELHLPTRLDTHWDDADRSNLD